MKSVLRLPLLVAVVFSMPVTGCDEPCCLSQHLGLLCASSRHCGRALLATSQARGFRWDPWREQLSIRAYGRRFSVASPTPGRKLTADKLIHRTFGLQFRLTGNSWHASQSCVRFASARD